MRSLHLYVGLIVFGVAVADSVVQFPPILPLTEGQGGTIDCNFTTSDRDPYLFWYRQLPNHPPHMLLRVSKQTPPEELTLEGLSARLYIDQKLLQLQLTRPSPGDDGAVYYCALRDGGNYKLIFGEGTQLTVLPYIPDSPPSVYLLKPPAGSEDQIGPACLTTDFSPAVNVMVFLNETKEGKRPATLVKTENEWSYGVVEWSAKRNDQQFKCMAKYKGTVNNAQQGEEDEEQKSCQMMSVSDNFETDEKLNTLSLSLLGLKIIFLKSIVFNLLMTLSLWIS